MPRFADVAFPTAVRQEFTYRIPEELSASRVQETRKLSTGDLKPGMRVWVPLRNQMAIGMVVRVHDTPPEREIRDIVSVLDSQPVLSEEMLELLQWVHRFYYASLGEVIQAALPAGLNYSAEPRIRLSKTGPDPPSKGIEREIVLFLQDSDKSNDISLKEISKRWQKSGEQAVKRLERKGLIEIWHIPKLRYKPKMQELWNWKNPHEADLFTSITSQVKEGKKTPRWIAALQTLKDLPLPATRKTITGLPQITAHTWNRIRNSGLIEKKEVPANAAGSDLPFDPQSISSLNTEQIAAVEPVLKALQSRTFHRFLLFGVTGSGKTEVYIHALQETLAQGRGGMILVPEIALTPQTVRRFHRVFGDQIAILHSRLNDRERYEAWTALQKKEKRIVIGPRSAVFAPVHDPGLIILDEEHDPSYKQEDPAPRYHARETAVMRAWKNQAVILTGSATPSLASLHAVASKKNTLLKLEQRHALARLPEVRILNLKEYRHAMRGPLAIPLYRAVKNALLKKEQIILLQNRRGFSTFLQCNDCGIVVECPHCSVSLTYHKAGKHLRCHYCGFSRLLPESCPSCENGHLAELGMGTQKVETELESLFPEARVLRMDQDSTSGKESHGRILEKFSSGKADILMGTQVVAKGLDFPNVTVVGVIQSDTELAFPSYRSSERMYQLLSQVAGRSGRSEKPGTVFLQTMMPDHPALYFAKTHDFQGFARQELKSRKNLNYPPYSRLVIIYFKSADSQTVADAAIVFTKILEKMIPGDRVIGPSPASIPKIKKHFIWEAHLKMPPDKGAHYLERFFDHAFRQYQANRPPSSGNVRIIVNVDSMH